MRRVLGKLMPDVPHETLLVLDATTGQNGLSQAIQFTQAVGATGIVLTKLDGTANQRFACFIANFSEREKSSLEPVTFAVLKKAELFWTKCSAFHVKATLSVEPLD